MDFAEKQLSKHGWTKGRGLGKEESGIKEAIKVKVKHDKVGVGHDPGEEFSFHWWDHVFNKAASKIHVKTTQDGVEVCNSGNTAVSKKKNSKTYDNKAMLYGQFVKGSTLTGGVETRHGTDGSSSEDDEDDKARETTQCLMPNQEDIVFQKCGGRTAHKGARHGLKLNGKLQRIEEQEKLLLESYRKNSKTETTKKKTVKEVGCSAENNVILAVDNPAKMKSNGRENDFSQQEFVVDASSETTKRKKKKKRKSTDLESVNDISVQKDINVTVPISEETDESTEKLQKCKKSKIVTCTENTARELDIVDGSEQDDSHTCTSKKKKNKKKKQCC